MDFQLFEGDGVFCSIGDMYEFRASSRLAVGDDIPSSYRNLDKATNEGREDDSIVGSD